MTVDWFAPTLVMAVLDTAICVLPKITGSSPVMTKKEELRRNDETWK
jgi:hypothetical protein